jgi:formamidopyrimidine-DNA glycosylase
MTGNLFAIPDWRLHSVRARAIFEMEDGSGLVFEDPRALGRIDLLPTAPLLARLDRQLGPEPLSPEFTPALFRDAARASRQPAKLFLMDQRRLAGLGNIYAAEALFEARIDPRRPLRRLRPARLDALHWAIVRILKDAVESAWNAYSGPGIWAEGETFACQVYGREGQPCPACGKAIRRIPQGGRSTYFCANCQR